MSLEELYAIMVLRQEVFSVEQECAYLDADGLDQVASHLLGRNLENQLISYARILAEGKKYQGHVALTRIVVAKEARKVGAGRELVRNALDVIQQKFGSTPVKISAQTYLIEFYQSFDFKIKGKEYLEDGIPHIEMILNR